MPQLPGCLPGPIKLFFLNLKPALMLLLLRIITGSRNVNPTESGIRFTKNQAFIHQYYDYFSFPDSLCRFSCFTKYKSPRHTKRHIHRNPIHRNKEQAHVIPTEFARQITDCSR